MPGIEGAFRLAPIAFLHTPTPQKPDRKATADQVAQYRLEASSSRLSLRAAQQMIQLRQSLDQDPRGRERTLILAFDGGYTNAAVLKQIPPRTICIGRIRKDAKLCFPPDPALLKTRGRRLRYGALAPTPEPLRIDDAEPWQSMTFAHSGVSHPLRFKRRQHMMWRITGVEQILQLIVIAPLAYRLRQGSKRTGPPPSNIEAYFQRWDIEVNFRNVRLF